MTATYLFVVILAAGYVGSRYIFSHIKLAREAQHIFLLGGEYILIGVILGPSVTNVLSPEVISSLTPIIMVGIGWLGLLLGNQLAWRNLRRFSMAMHEFLVLENLFYFILMVPILYWSLHTGLPLSANMGSSGFWIILAGLAATSPTAINIISHHLRVPMRFTMLLRFLSALDGVFAIVMLGVIYGLKHESARLGFLVLSGWHWILVPIALGVLGGLFFHFLLHFGKSDSELVLITMGIIIYVGGMAFLLKLSALFVAFIIGVITANYSERHAKLSQILSATEKPFYIVFLIFAGALWQFEYWSVFIFAPLLFLLRIVVKWAGSFVTAKMLPPFRDLPAVHGLGLCSLAGLTLAIALEYNLLSPGSQSEWILGLMIVIVLLNQILSPLILRKLLPALRSE